VTIMTDSLTSLDSSIKHGYAQVGDVRLHYAESGGGDRLVVLLHGFPECWHSWRHQLSALSTRFRVVAPDLRGYNLSDKPPRVAEYRVEKLVDDVTGLVRHLGARRAAVVGHDWGAAVAWAVAQRHPEYVSKLAALQVPPAAVWKKNISLRQMLKSWYMFFFQLPALPEWFIGRDDFAGLEKTFRSTARPGTFTDTDLAVYRAALREPGALTAAINYYRANVFSLFAGGGESRRWAETKIGVPTLFIYGERDPFVIPETVRGVGDFVEAPYREVRLARAGHWVQQEYPQEVNAALASFLED
jgi:pimeloyl-ACP methyl ester carboxylesterase